MTDQLRTLCKPFPRSLIQAPAPGAYGDYVKHSAVTEKLLGAIGGVDTELVSVVRGENGHVEGVVLKMTATIDGTTHTVTEAGDAVGGGNWSNDGQRLKDGFSDAYKRCAMRLGVGLHLWSGPDFFLSRVLENRADEANQTTEGDDA